MKLLFGVSIGLSLLAFALGVFFPGAVDATCCQPEGETCAWQSGPSPNPQSDPSTGEFEFEITFDWCFSENANFTGDFEYVSSGSSNINTTLLSYAPAYYFTTACSGSKTVTASGFLSDHQDPGTLVTKGEIGAGGGPSCSKNKSVDIN